MYTKTTCIDQKLQPRFKFMNRHVDRETDRPKTVCPVTQLGEVKFENQITSSYFIVFFSC